MKREKIEMFQFPTNGKAHLNIVKKGCPFFIKRFVSIPYERESTSERSICTLPKAEPKGFNSLRTGKHI